MAQLMGRRNAYLLSAALLLASCTSTKAETSNTQVGSLHITSTVGNPQLPGHSCSPTGPNGQTVVLAHLGDGKCDRYSNQIPITPGDMPGTQPFQLPPFSPLPFSIGGIKNLTPVVMSKASTYTLKFVAVSNSSDAGLFCVSRDPIDLIITGPGLSSKGLDFSNYPCRYSQLFGNIFPTISGASYTMVLHGKTPLQWLLVAAEARPAPKEKPTTASAQQS
jgi:hypothetical protein